MYVYILLLYMCIDYVYLPVLTHHNDTCLYTPHILHICVHTTHTYAYKYIGTTKHVCSHLSIHLYIDVEQHVNAFFRVLTTVPNIKKIIKLIYAY